MAKGQCIYCGTPQVGGHVDDALYRCHRCNYYLRDSWLVDDIREFVLDGERAWLCPWCAYPVAIEQKVPDDRTREFACDGCGGTVFGEMLVTQAAVNAEKKTSMNSRTYLLFVLAALGAMFVIFGWVLR